MRKLLYLSKVILLTLLSFRLWSQHYPVTDRSLAYTTAYTIPVGGLQTESGFVRVWDIDKTSGINLNLVSLNLRYGLTSFSEIRIGTSYQHLNAFNEKSVGLSGLNISTKIALKPDGNLPAIYLQSGIVTDIAQAEAFKQSRLTPYSKLIIEKYLSDMFIIGSNIGYRWNSTEEQSLTYALTMRTSITDYISLYTEFYGVNEKFGPSKNFVDAALEFWIIDRTVIDFVYGRGVSEIGDGGFWSIGFSKLW